MSEAVVVGQMNIHTALKTYFGYDVFRGKQQEIIESVLDDRDAFVIMPTGAGKSLCYQLPAIVREGTALVISPLIALMKNQVDQLTSLGIDAGYLNSSMSRHDYDAIKKKAVIGELKLLYVAPETLVRDEFMDFLRSIHLAFVAVDEAHCISEWGHDFRPEYRRIRPILSTIKRVPIIALTATATPKVQLDIQKNLQIEDADVFKTSFNRSNLYYEIRPKINPIQDIVKFIKQNLNKSGIVYCLSRKKVEEISELLNVNGIKTAPYHAGLDSETRSLHQDMFLQERVQVIVATIAFGMGIDKPDVRFVIHYDVPKSIESYYQETGRAGRDGLEGNCVLYYNFSDITKLEKFMKDKPLSEREANKHLLYEMAAFCESGLCRRKQLLHYFGEIFNEQLCLQMCDNCRHPKEHFEATNEVTLALRCVGETGNSFGINYLISVLRGSNSQQIKELQHDQTTVFGKGAHVEEKDWKSLFVQLLVRDFISKDITNYGVIRLTEQGVAFAKEPHQIELVRFQDFLRLEKEALHQQLQLHNHHHNHQVEEFKAYDDLLLVKLKKLRKQKAEELSLPPYIIFQENSLIEMATKFPMSVTEFENIHAVGAAKARKFSKPFIELIAKHVEEHEIDRPEDIVVKTQGKNSADKLYIIQQIDRKVPLDDIADSKGMSYEDVINKVEQIIFSGSKLNIDYFIEQVIDDDKKASIYDYFMQSETESLLEAGRALGSSFSKEEIQLVRAKFYAEKAL